MSDMAGETSLDVLVLGGGLAGLAAGLRLAEQGRRVGLVETSRRLGGRASSHVDPDTGEMTDNCQHVVLGCCTNLLDFYKRLNVADQIAWFDAMHFFDAEGHHDVLKSSGLPAPLHLAGAMGRFTTLSKAEKKQINRAMFSMLRLGPARRWQFSGLTFGEWLSRHGQQDRTISRYWNVVIESALNLNVNEVAAVYALQVFQDGFLAHREAYKMGVSRIPLRRLYEPATGRIESAGGRVMMGRSVDRLLFDGKQVNGVRLADGAMLEAPQVISALPFDRLHKAACERLREADERFRHLEAFAFSSILGIHLWFESPVMDLAHMVLMDSPLQWVFNKTEVEGGSGQYLHAIISAADRWMNEPGEKLVEMALRELARYLPRVAGTALVRGKAVKEKRATFRLKPGLDAIRPAAQGKVENLILAGDWTATGWPATMEGAVRSGYRAAEVCVTGAASLLVADLPRSPICRSLEILGLFC